MNKDCLMKGGETMKTILEVTPHADDPNRLIVTYPKGHPREPDIRRWLTYLSPGYVEYLLQHETDPHCRDCGDVECENVGHGDDACKGFRIGKEW